MKIAKINELDEDMKITVCDSCFRACCWQGVYMCNESRDAGITEKTVAELRKLNYEHSSYWRKNE
jgi:epoxyqueuosine reductase QueG